MCGQEVAWWCSSTQPFTLRSFVILVMSGELSPFGNPATQSALNDPATQTKMANTVANWFSDSCLAHPNCAGATLNAISNWLGENFESGQRLFSNDAIPTPYPALSGLATKVVNAVMSVDSTPSQTGFNESIHWENRSYYEGEYGKGHYPTENYRVLSGDNWFYVIPYAEEARMCGAWPCP
jgi:hypothetical protein